MRNLNIKQRAIFCTPQFFFKTLIKVIHLRKEEVKSRYILCIIRTSINEDDLYVVHKIQGMALFFINSTIIQYDSYYYS